MNHTPRLTLAALTHWLRRGAGGVGSRNVHTRTVTLAPVHRQQRGNVRPLSVTIPRAPIGCQSNNPASARELHALLTQFHRQWPLALRYPHYTDPLYEQHRHALAIAITNLLNTGRVLAPYDFHLCLTVCYMARMTRRGEELYRRTKDENVRVNFSSLAIIVKILILRREVDEVPALLVRLAHHSTSDCAKNSRLITELTQQWLDVLTANNHSSRDTANAVQQFLSFRESVQAGPSLRSPLAESHYCTAIEFAINNACEAALVNQLISSLITDAIIPSPSLTLALAQFYATSHFYDRALSFFHYLTKTLLIVEIPTSVIQWMMKICLECDHPRAVVRMLEQWKVCGRLQPLPVLTAACDAITDRSHVALIDLVIAEANHTIKHYISTGDDQDSDNVNVASSPPFLSFLYSYTRLLALTRQHKHRVKASRLYHKYNLASISSHTLAESDEALVVRQLLSLIALNDCDAVFRSLALCPSLALNRTITYHLVSHCVANNDSVAINKLLALLTFSSLRPATVRLLVEYYNENRALRDSLLKSFTEDRSSLIVVSNDGHGYEVNVAQLPHAIDLVAVIELLVLSARHCPRRAVAANDASPLNQWLRGVQQLAFSAASDRDHTPANVSRQFDISIPLSAASWHHQQTLKAFESHSMKLSLQSTDSAIVVPVNAVVRHLRPATTVVAQPQLQLVKPKAEASVQSLGHGVASVAVVVDTPAATAVPVRVLPATRKETRSSLPQVDLDPKLKRERILAAAESRQWRKRQQRFVRRRAVLARIQHALTLRRRFTTAAAATACRSPAAKTTAARRSRARVKPGSRTVE